MTDTLNSDLRMVAEYEGYYWEGGKLISPKDGSYMLFTHNPFTEWVSGWSRQIPVFAKLAKEYENGTIKKYRLPLFGDYFSAIAANNPQAGFDIIVKILKQKN